MYHPFLRAVCGISSFQQSATAPQNLFVFFLLFILKFENSFGIFQDRHSSSKGNLTAANKVHHLSQSCAFVVAKETDSIQAFITSAHLVGDLPLLFEPGAFPRRMSFHKLSSFLLATCPKYHILCFSHTMPSTGSSSSSTIESSTMTATPLYIRFLMKRRNFHWMK